MKTRVERLFAWIEAGSPAAMAVSWFAAIVLVSAIIWGCTGSVRSKENKEPCTPYYDNYGRAIGCVQDL